MKTLQESLQNALIKEASQSKAIANKILNITNNGELIDIVNDIAATRNTKEIKRLVNLALDITNNGDVIELLNKLNEAKDTEKSADDGDGEVETEAEFRAYAQKLLKKGHGDKYDADKAKKMIDDLVKKHGSDDKWGDAVGVIQNAMD